jgi:hypothetical protein
MADRSTGRTGLPRQRPSGDASQNGSSMIWAARRSASGSTWLSTSWVVRDGAPSVPTRRCIGCCGPPWSARTVAELRRASWSTITGTPVTTQSSRNSLGHGQSLPRGSHGLPQSPPAGVRSPPSCYHNPRRSKISAPVDTSLTAGIRLRRSSRVCLPVDIRRRSPATQTIPPSTRPSRARVWVRVCPASTMRVDRTWQYPNRVCAAQGPIVMVKPVGKPGSPKSRARALGRAKLSTARTGRPLTAHVSRWTELRAVPAGPIVRPPRADC